MAGRDLNVKTNPKGPIIPALQIYTHVARKVEVLARATSSKGIEGMAR
jgi:hypothetical protein